MSPMPRMRLAMRVGMEILERIHLLAGADQLDRLAGDGAHRQRRAAAAVAVDAGQHDAGDADAIVEILGEIDRVLAGEAVGDEQDLMRIATAALISTISAISASSIWVRPGRVEQHDVIALQPRRLFGALARSAPASGRRRSAACRCRPGGRARRAAPAPPAASRRARPSAPCASSAR